MMRRLLLALALLLLAPIAAKAQTCRDTNSCNIIVILADDLAVGAVESYGEVIGGLGGSFSTPGIDALAASGVRFANGYAVSPLCAPSRASLFKGLYPQRSGVRDNNTVPNNAWWTGQTVPGMLQDAGYTTALIGKSHLGAPPVGDPWDHYAVLSTNQGTYDNPIFYENSQSVTTTHNASANCVSLADHPDDSQCYFTDEITHMSTDWMTANKDAAGPFFLVMSHKATHSEWVPAIRHENDLQASTPAQSATYGDTRSGRAAQVQDYTQLIFAGLYNSWTTGLFDDARPTGYGKEATPGGTDAQKKAWVTEQLQEDYLETAQALDDSVATIVAYLDANSASGETGDLLANTIIIFISDNGYLVSEHGLHFKNMPYENSVRIPMIMAGPGISAAQVKSEIVTTVDVSATILDLANVTPPDSTYMVGRTLFDIVPTPVGAPWRTAALIWSSYTFGDFTPAISPWYALITSDWWLIRHYDETGGNSRAWELIDRLSDPNELTNVYDVPTNFATREALKTQLRTLVSESGMPSWRDTQLVSP